MTSGHRAVDPIAFERLVIEDGAPVDNLHSERQMRLLVETLYSSWAGPSGGGKFLAMANVGVFSSVEEPPIVPDVLVAVGVEPPPDLSKKEHRAYFIWMLGKAPDVVIEVVSNTEGGEDTRKLERYAELGVSSVVIFDPDRVLRKGRLRIYELRAGRYAETPRAILPSLGLGLSLWKGVYEGISGLWVRWCEPSGWLLPTGVELIRSETARADEAEARAGDAEARAGDAEARARELEARLRALGEEP